LRSNFDGQGADFEQDNGGLAVECAACGDRTLARTASRVRSCQNASFSSTFDEQVRLEELRDRPK